MTTRSPPSVDRYTCAVVGQDVNVTAQTFTSPDRRALAKVMKGCSGAHSCGLFPVPMMFASIEPTGCPYHDNLNKG